MRVLDLFSGIGGFSLGLERAGMKTVAFCEIDPFCQKVLKKHWPDVPIYEDVRTIDGNAISAEIVTGGYPCQPFSTAGKRGGAEDDRHLWPEMYRIIKAVRPRWVIAENVAGHISMGLDAVLSDLEAENYTCWTFVIPACAIDAEHIRDRVWIIAHFDMQRELQPERLEQEQRRRLGDGVKKDASNPDSTRWKGRMQAGADNSNVGSFDAGMRPAINNANPISREYWNHKPVLGRGIHGISRRLDRIRSLGNAVVPQIPEMIGRAILQAEAA